MNSQQTIDGSLIIVDSIETHLHNWSWWISFYSTCSILVCCY